MTVSDPAGGSRTPVPDDDARRDRHLLTLRTLVGEPSSTAVVERAWQDPVGVWGAVRWALGELTRPLPCTCDWSGAIPDEPHKPYCEKEYGPHAECGAREEALEFDRDRLRAAGDALALALRPFVLPGAKPTPDDLTRGRRARVAWRSVRGDAPSVPAGLPETLASVEDVRKRCEAHGLEKYVSGNGLAVWWSRSDRVGVVIKEENGELVGVGVSRLLSWTEQLAERVAEIDARAPGWLLSDAIRAARVPADPGEA